MEFAGRPFPGKVDFIKTYMTWPINHMIAPAENALACEDCLNKNGRLKQLDGNVIPDLC